MTNYLSRFPDGAAGLGLLLARTCCAPAAFGVAALLPSFSIGATTLRLATGVVALLLTAGFATRVSAVVLGVAVIAAFPGATPLEQLLLAGNMGVCAAIVLLGAGAYSIDARRHGRRVVYLRTRTPDRGEED